MAAVRFQLIAQETLRQTPVVRVAVINPIGNLISGEIGEWLFFRLHFADAVRQWKFVFKNERWNLLTIQMRCGTGPCYSRTETLGAAMRIGRIEIVGTLATLITSWADNIWLKKIATQSQLIEENCCARVGKVFFDME